MNYKQQVLVEAFLIFIIGLCCIIILIAINSCGTRHEPRIIDKRVQVEDTKQYQKDTIIVYGYHYDSVYAYGNWYYIKDIVDSLKSELFWQIALKNGLKDKLEDCTETNNMIAADYHKEVERYNELYENNVPKSRIGEVYEDLANMKLRMEFYKSEYERLSRGK